MKHRRLIKIIGLIIYISTFVGVIQLGNYINYLDKTNPFVSYQLENVWWAITLVSVWFFGIGWAIAEIGASKQKDAIEYMDEQYRWMYGQLDILGFVADFFKFPKHKINVVDISIVVLVLVLLSSLIIGLSIN